MGVRTERSEDRVRAVKDAAWALFVKRGYEATTVRQIAARAGVATGTVMNHGGKPALLLALFEDAIATHMRSQRQRRAGPRTTIWRCYQPYFEFYAANPELARAYGRALLSPAGRRHRALGAQAREFNALVAGQIGDQFPHVSAADAAGAADALFAIYIHSLVTWASEAATLGEAVTSFRRMLGWQLARFEH